MGKITTKKRILFSFRGQVTINGQIMSEKPGIFCAQNGQKLWVFGQPEGVDVHAFDENGKRYSWGYTCCDMETALHRKDELLKKYPQVVVRDNATRKEKMYH